MRLLFFVAVALALPLSAREPTAKDLSHRSRQVQGIEASTAGLANSTTCRCSMLTR